jgi:peptidoglycan/LPS O-acetylase OafA/YrhL
VQGLRAVAILLVVLYHAGLPVPGGFIGVDVFFVISGFVIIRMLHAELERTDRINLARFYTRRVLRILPALAIAIAVTVMVSWFVLSPFGTQQVTGNTAVAASAFVANVFLAGSTGGYFDESIPNALLHTWSLSVE